MFYCVPLSVSFKLSWSFDGPYLKTKNDLYKCRLCCSVRRIQFALCSCNWPLVYSVQKADVLGLMRRDFLVCSGGIIGW